MSQLRYLKIVFYLTHVTTTLKMSMWSQLSKNFSKDLFVKDADQKKMKQQKNSFILIYKKLQKDTKFFYFPFLQTFSKFIKEKTQNMIKILN